MKTNFVMLKRGEILNDLLSEHPNAFLLLTLIAVRARRTPNLIKNLDICECQLGDYKSCGLTEQKYRTAKSTLEKLKLATFTPTNKGTIAKLINTDIYDINTEEHNGQSNKRITDKQRTGNEQVTTNNNVNKEKNENTISVPLKDGTFFIPENKYLETLKSTYKKIDINMELNKLIVWNISNPSKQKTKNGIKRHINTWMSGADDKKTPVSSTDISTESWF